MPAEIKAVVLTISDSASRGEREDLSGPAVVGELQNLKAVIVATEIIADDRELIAERLRHYADTASANLIVTTGGTGFAMRDITPEATQDVLDRIAPGLAELMRLESLKITPLAALSRSVCGIRKQTLIVNLPGSVRGSKENFSAIARLLPHAIDLLTGAS
jgi:molybdenum cofactor synthesis domain-containing protein